MNVLLIAVVVAAIFAGMAATQPLVARWRPEWVWGERR